MRRRYFIGFLVAATRDCATVSSLKTTISPQAPIKERRRLITDAIATKTVELYRSTDDFAFTKEAMSCRYDEIVPGCDRWWLSEDFYCWLVEYAIHSTDVNRYCGDPIQTV